MRYILALVPCLALAQTPHLDLIVPSSGEPGTSVTVTISGSNLSGAQIIGPTSVISTSAVSSSASQITATLNIASGAALGPIQISVQAAGVASNAVAFLVGGAARIVETRAVAGFGQSAASAATARQAFLFDLFILRPLGSGATPAHARFNIWGNVRIGSSPQQINTPAVHFLSTAGQALSALKVNQLAASAEFLTGLEVHLGEWTQQNHVRTLGWVLNGGATAPANPVDSMSIFQVPQAGSAQYAQFAQAYPAAKNVPYVAFVNPDRQRFYKQWGTGIRVTTLHQDGPPATYMVTIGQDELITGGALKSAVGRIDVFYPLPLGTALKSIYLFGTAAMRLGNASNAPMLALNPAPASVNAYDAGVAIVSVPSNRDTYRIGIGIDVLALLDRIKVSMN